MSNKLKTLVKGFTVNPIMSFNNDVVVNDSLSNEFNYNLYPYIVGMKDYADKFKITVFYKKNEVMTYKEALKERFNVYCFRLVYNKANKNYSLSRSHIADMTDVYSFGTSESFITQEIVHTSTINLVNDHFKVFRNLMQENIMSALNGTINNRFELERSIKDVYTVLNAFLLSHLQEQGICEQYTSKSFASFKSLIKLN